MTRKPKTKAAANRNTLDPETLYFIPLGGSEQFGVNLNVYAYGGSLLVVDCGIGFADERYPGIDLLLPDPAFLEDRQKDIAGLIITHAHEDHIGAVAYLWEALRCPVYASPFTANILREKMNETGLKKVPVHIIDPMKTVKAGKAFSFKFIPVTHSIPQASAVLIETGAGKVLHSADWNMDPTPVLGKPIDEAVFRAMGDDGILAYIGDSTNANVPGRAGSEAEVEVGLTKEFKRWQGRIAITIFSSNIGRVQSISRAAHASGRKVMVVGRSLHRMIGAAKDCGLMKDVPEFISEEDFNHLPPSGTVMIVTGSQGEARSALARIARDDHHFVKLSKGDTVIFSSREIPGNEKAVNVVKNNLSAGGINIVTPDDTKNRIHVSGHPCRDEIADMYAWVRPDIVIPVHGERTQLDAQARFAREQGVKNVVVPTNGAVIRLGPGTPEVVDHVPAGLLAVDQKRIIKADHASIADRRKLQYSGAMHVSLVLDKTGKVVAGPHVDSMGLVDPQDPRENTFDEKMETEILDILDDMTRGELTDDHFVSEELRIGLRRYAVHMLGIKPKVTVHLMRV